MRTPRQLQLFADLFPEDASETACGEVPESSAALAAPAPAFRPADPASHLARRLEEALDHPLGGLTLTDNKSRIVSARRNGDALDVRIHRAFVNAPEATLRSVAEFLEGARGRRRARALADIRDHFEKYGQQSSRDLKGNRRKRRRVLRPVGRHHDLREIFAEVNQKYFDGELDDVQVTWGRAITERRRQRGNGYSIRLGCYHDDDNLVRIHRALDQAWVPRYVVASVVYHEMLHAVVPIEKGGGERRRIHTPEFRRREREFERFGEAERWIEDNLARLAKA